MLPTKVAPFTSTINSPIKVTTKNGMLIKIPIITCFKNNDFLVKPLAMSNSVKPSFSSCFISWLAIKILNSPYASPKNNIIDTMNKVASVKSPGGIGPAIAVIAGDSSAMRMLMRSRGSLYNSSIINATSSVTPDSAATHMTTFNHIAFICNWK